MLTVRRLVGEMGLELAAGRDGAGAPVRSVVADLADVFPELERRGCTFSVEPVPAPTTTA